MCYSSAGLAVDVKKDWVPLGPPYFMALLLYAPPLRLTLAAPIHPVTDILQRASSGPSSTGKATSKDNFR